MKTAKEALATHLGMSYSDLTEYNYQRGHWSASIYAIGQEVYCCVKNGRKPATPNRKGLEPKQWEEVKDEFVNTHGWSIYKA